MQTTLKGYQRKYLRGLAHPLKPIILVGQKGATHTLAQALDDALAHHELVKIKFIEGKAKEDKKRVVDALQKITHAGLVGMIGHTVIFYRPHPQKEKRKILLPRTGS